MTTNFEHFPLLTDAESNNPNSFQVPNDGDFGLDTVTVAFPISPSLLDLDTPLWRRSSSGIHLDSGKEFANHVGYLALDHGDVRVSVNIHKEICWLHFNAARIITGKSRQLLPPDALKPLVAGILDSIAESVGGVFDINEATGELGRDSNWAKQVKVYRLDVARNLKVAHPTQTKKALVEAIPSYGKTQHVYEQYNGGGWTLVNGTETTGKDRIYDKDAELAGIKAEETLTDETSWFRFETQLETDRLQKYGLSTLDRIDSVRCWEALEERWVVCKWGIVVNEPGTLIKVVESLDPKEMQALVGFLWQCEQGLEFGHTKARISHYRKLAASLGLNPGMSLDDQGIGQVRLDLRHGGEIPVDPQGYRNRCEVPTRWRT